MILSARVELLLAAVHGADELFGVAVRGDAGHVVVNIARNGIVVPRLTVRRMGSSGYRTRTADTACRGSRNSSGSRTTMSGWLSVSDRWISRALRQHPHTRRPRVLLMAWANPLPFIGRGSAINTLVVLTPLVDGRPCSEGSLRSRPRSSVTLWQV